MRNGLAVLALALALSTAPFVAHAKTGGPSPTNPNIPLPGPQFQIPCDLTVVEVQILLPDYTPAPANPLPVLAPGQSFHVRARIKNIGSASAATTLLGLQVVKFSPNDPVVLLPVPSILPGQEKIVTFDVGGLPLGTYPTHVYADYTKILKNESSTQNNHGLTTVVVQTVQQ